MGFVRHYALFTELPLSRCPPKKKHDTYFHINNNSTHGDLCIDAPPPKGQVLFGVLPKLIYLCKK